jgi:hypothetical protein
VRLQSLAAVVCLFGLVACSSDGADEDSEADIAAGSTDGYDWRAVSFEESGQTCVGFVVDDQPMGQSCDIEGAFPDTTPVLDYQGTVAQGMDRTGFVFLAAGRADQVVVTFADGSEVVEDFERLEVLDGGLVAVAFVGPKAANPERVVVADSEGRALLDVEVPLPPTSIP